MTTYGIISIIIGLPTLVCMAAAIHWRDDECCQWPAANEIDMDDWT